MWTRNRFTLPTHSLTTEPQLSRFFVIINGGRSILMPFPPPSWFIIWTEFKLTCQFVRPRQQHSSSWRDDNSWLMIDGKYTSLFFITCARILGFRCYYLHTGMLEETQEEVSGLGIRAPGRDHGHHCSSQRTWFYAFIIFSIKQFGIKHVVKIYNTYT